eukprot:5363338-Pleurochrysis_carterae.AAC.2
MPDCLALARAKSLARADRSPAFTRTINCGYVLRFKSSEKGGVRRLFRTRSVDRPVVLVRRAPHELSHVSARILEGLAAQVALHTIAEEDRAALGEEARMEQGRRVDEHVGIVVQQHDLIKRRCEQREGLTHVALESTQLIRWERGRDHVGEVVDLRGKQTAVLKCAEVTIHDRMPDLV